MTDGQGGDYADPIVLPFSITIPDPRPVVNDGMSRLAPVVNHPANGWPGNRPAQDWSFDRILGFATELFGTPAARAQEGPPEERDEEEERRDLEEEKGPDVLGALPAPRVTVPGGPRIGHLLPGGVGSVEPGGYAQQSAPALTLAPKPTTAQTVVFGTSPNSISHAFRHIERLDLDRTMVMNAIISDLEAHVPISLGADNSPFKGQVMVNGIQLRYVAYPLPNGVVNVGRIIGPR